MLHIWRLVSKLRSLFRVPGSIPWVNKLKEMDLPCSLEVYDQISCSSSRCFETDFAIKLSHFETNKANHFKLLLFGLSAIFSFQKVAKKTRFDRKKLNKIRYFSPRENTFHKKVVCLCYFSKTFEVQMYQPNKQKVTGILFQAHFERTKWVLSFNSILVRDYELHCVRLGFDWFFFLFTVLESLKQYLHNHNLVWFLLKSPRRHPARAVFGGPRGHGSLP